MKLKFSALLLFLLMTLVEAQAQSYKIGGQIKDQNNKEVSFASLVIYNPADTSMVTYGMASEEGKYVITGLKKGAYLLYSACVGYSETYILFTIKDENKLININLETDANILETFKVYAKKTPIMYNGDTLVYNAKFFKTKTNASVEDLLKKLPGMRLDKNGNIVSEGQEVIKVLINGKEFFGNDVKMATKNLDAEAVKKIKVINQKTDEDNETGEDNKTTEKVINLVLKKEYSKGFFGTIGASYGTDDRYLASGNINFFAPKAQLTIIGGLNNINKQVFGWSAIRSLNANTINPNYDWFSSSSWRNGIATEKGIGANLNLTPKKGIDLNFSYLKGNTVKEGITDTKSENYLETRTLLSESNTKNTFNDTKDVFSTLMRIKIDSLNFLNVKGQVNIKSGLNKSASLKHHNLQSGEVINSAVRQSEQNTSISDFSGKVRYTRQGKKKKDKQNNFYNTSIYFKKGESDGQKTNYFNTVNGMILPFPSGDNWLITDKLNAQETNLSFNNKFKIGLSKKAGLSLGLNLQNIFNQYDYQWIPTFMSKVISNSPIGEVNTQIVEPYVNMNYAVSKHANLYVTLKYNYYTEDRELKTNTDNSFIFKKGYILPRVYFNANKPKKYRMHMSLGSDVRPVNISNLLPITDYSNPFYIQQGNIELSNPVRYYFYSNYNKTLNNNNSFRLYTWSQFTNDALVNNATIDNNNYRTSQMINYKNAKNTYNEIEYIYFVKKLKMDAGVAVNYSANQSYFIQNDIPLNNVSHTVGLEPMIGFDKFDKWNLDVSYEINRRYSKIDIADANVFWSNSIQVEFVLNPKDWFEISTELDWFTNSSVNNYANNSTPLWNAEVSFFMGKKKQWTVGASIFDILNANQNISRYLSQNSFTETSQNTLTQYAMFSVRYKIKKPKGRQKRRRRHH